MNFYPFHIGDYLAHTAHLDDLRDLAYRRLLDRYYLTEKPLPLDVESVADKIRMGDTPEKLRAVQRVLAEFFEQTPEGWRQERADAELGVMQQKQGAVEEREQHEQTRLQKHREKRSLMFQALAQIGVFPAWNVKTPELSTLFEQHIRAPETPRLSNGETAPATAPETPETLAATAIVRTLPTPTPTPIPIPITNSLSSLSSLPPSTDLVLPTDLIGDVIPELDDGLPRCPTAAILRLWAELMPELQQPVKWTAAREAQLRQRWREEAVELKWRTADDGLRVFAKLFRWCRQSPFLMGKTSPAQGRQQFALTLPWLAKAENWAKVQEGNFHS